MSQDKNCFNEAYNAGKKQIIQTESNGVPLFVIPDDMKIEILDELVDARADRPKRLRQHVELLSVDSFIEYHNRFAISSSTIFVDTEKGRFISVLDYHDSPSEPAWKLHTCEYNCPKTKEWRAWIENNNAKMDQETFALFIEDNVTEISEPDGAAMLEIAASLKAKKDVDFKSGIRLDNGQTQFNYQETIDGQAGVNGQLEIPDIIVLAIKPFRMGAPYECKARFRYRISSNGLSMWYTLIRPHLIHDDAVNDVLEKIKTEMGLGGIIQAKYP